MESRGTALWRVLVCGLAFVVSTGWQQTAAPVDPITPLTLDVASCAGLDPRAADGPRMEGPTYPTPDPDGLLVQLESLERQLADAADADVPELLFALGRLRTAFYVGEDSPHAGYAASRPEEFQISWGLWVYRGTDFQELIRRYPGSEWADDAAYALSLVPRLHHCEGDLACRLNVAWEPIAAFLQAYPDSPFAAAAVDRALAAFGEVETDLDLRSTAYWFHDPDRVRALVESLDGVGKLLPTPQGTRLLERAAQLWWQYSDYERAGAAYRAAQIGATPEVRSCLDARLDAVPDAWLTLDPTRVLHPGRIELNWQPPDAAVRAFVVYRSPAASELGVAVVRLPADAHTWTDTGTVPSGAYWYRVVAELPDGVLQSNASQAETPPLSLVVQGVAVSTRDEYLHVFGELYNEFPQVIRLAPDGSVFERRNSEFIGVGNPTSPYARYVDEVWLTDHGGLGVLSFPGAPGRLPASLILAARQGVEHLIDYSRPSPGNRLLISLDETENAVWTVRGGGAPWSSIDCVDRLAICWLSGRGGVSLRDETGQIITTVDLRGRGGNPEHVYADPRDGSVWAQSGRRLLHLGLDGVILTDLTLATGGPVLTADLDRDRVIWFTRWVPDRHELVRIDVDDPTLRQEIVAVDVPSLPKMAPDLNGGVWLVTDDEALRIDRSGRTILRAPLDGPSRP